MNLAILAEPMAKELDRRVRAKALARIALGTAQMMGAVLSAYLLIATGVSKLSLIAAVATCSLTAISMLFFGSRSEKE
jgi:hypothetical protein